MTKEQSTQVKTGNKKRGWKKLTVVAVILVIIALAFVFIRYQIVHNYAQDEARVFEQALIAKGAVKQCDRSATGRGWDQSEPWYAALYEVPGNRNEAAELVSQAAKDAGYSLNEVFPDIVREDNRFFEDRTSKPSRISALENGNIEVIVEVYGSSTHTDGDDPFCTVTKRENPPIDRTTVDVTFNLPSYR